MMSNEGRRTILFFLFLLGNLSFVRKRELTFWPFNRRFVAICFLKDLPCGRLKRTDYWGRGHTRTLTLYPSIRFPRPVSSVTPVYLLLPYFMCINVSTDKLSTREWSLQQTDTGRSNRSGIVHAHSNQQWHPSCRVIKIENNQAGQQAAASKPLISEG